MIATTFAAAALALAGPAVAGPAIAPPADTLAYRVPSPPTAVYHAEETRSANVVTPVGEMGVSGDYVFTATLAFEEGEGVVRVSGTVDDLQGTWDNPLSGISRPQPEDLVGNRIDFALSPRGEVEITTMPELVGPTAQLAPFDALASELFPRVPARAVEPGDVWVDTVTWSVSVESRDKTQTTVFEYTVVGDTLVDGRTLLHIAMSGEVTSETDIEQAGIALTQTVSGTTTGHALWDAERGLFVSMTYSHDTQGTSDVATIGVIELTAKSTRRFRLRP